MIQSPTLNDFKNLVEMVTGINAKLEHLATSISNEVKKITAEISTEVQNSLKINNSKLCYFIIDCLKACFPNTLKLKSEQSKTIAAAFKFHELGPIDAANLSKYVDQLSKLSSHYEPLR